MSFLNWSTTANSNASVGAIFWAEGQNSNTVNNSARSMMADLADVRDGNVPMYDTFTLCDPVDTTKRFRFDGAAVSTGTARVITMPDKSGTMAFTSDVPSLTAPFLTYGSLGGLTSGRILTPGDGINFTDSSTAGAMTVAQSFATTGAVTAGASAVLSVTPASLKAALGLSSIFESSEQTISTSTLLTIAHGMSGVPKLFQTILRCKTNDANFGAGQEVVVNYDSGNNRGIQTYADATNVYIATGVNLYQVISPASFAAAAITAANWRIVVRVWA